MADYENLLARGKYAEAGKLMDAELGKGGNDRLFYLRAVVSYKLRSYDHALEMLERALMSKRDPDYLKVKALVLMETLDYKSAFECLEESLKLKDDAESHFLAFMCLMFLDDPGSRKHLRLAYSLDKAKTSSLLKDFYSAFFKNNAFLSESEKKALEAKLGLIK